MRSERDPEPVFDQARRLPAGPERDAYLLGACGADLALRSKVDALLAADLEATGFLAEPAGGRDAVSGESPGQSIGRYKLLQQIGEGGFGTVWMAEQREPVRRRVALKIIKLGMDTKQVIARFEAERQALALMDHPNIAKVLDAGATGTGRPFFVMELVKGVSIVEYCDVERLDTPARLALFVKVCNAIQHAHQKGIIHRDIKPSNVLVTLHDGVPVPKVIDFGIAKATNQELTEKTLFTEHRQLIGTPDYMSPEQAEMSGLDVDTRTDVYALGVLLYELLTGTTPFDARRLLQAGYDAMLRAIREDEPQKPSTRLSTLGETATRAAGQRRTDVRRLGSLLRGDLDWIAMRCLEKDRTRRYETANGLAADVERHLRHEPVVAGPPSASYRLKKFARRHRVGVLSGAAIAVVLVAGVVGTTWGLLWALDEKVRADDAARSAIAAAAAESEARLAAQQSAERATQQTQRAERELARATEVKRLITEMLQGVDPEEARGADTTLLQGILDTAAARLAQGEVTDELVAAELHHVIGEVYLALARYPEGEEHLAAAVEVRTRLLGEEHEDARASAGKLANLLLHAGRIEDGEKILRRLLEIQIRVAGEESREVVFTLDTLGGACARLGRFEESEALLLRADGIAARVLDEADLGRLQCLNDLGSLYMNQAKNAEAEAVFDEFLSICRRRLREDDKPTRYAMYNLAIVYRDEGRYSESEELLTKVMEIDRRFFGDEHPETLQERIELGLLFALEARYDEAEQHIRPALEGVRKLLGEEHQLTLEAMQRLGETLRLRGRYDEAEPLLEEALRLAKRTLGEESLTALLAERSLGCLLRDAGRYEESRVLLAKTLDAWSRGWGVENAESLNTRTELGRLYVAMGRFGEAADLLGPHMDAMRGTPGVDRHFTRDALQALAEAYLGLGRADLARPLCLELQGDLRPLVLDPNAVARTLWLTAWVLTRDVDGVRDPERGLELAARALREAEREGAGELWTYHDLLAQAHGLAGDVPAALRSERAALALVPAGHPLRSRYEERLSAWSPAEDGVPVESDERER